MYSINKEVNTIYGKATIVKVKENSVITFNEFGEFETSFKHLNVMNKVFN